MSAPSIFMNNYLKETYEFRIDQFSKIYIVSGFLFGLCRLPVAFKMKSFCKLLALTYSALFSFGYISYFLYVNHLQISDFVLFFHLIQYVVCNAVATVSWKTIGSYYGELYEFDGEIGSKLLTSSDSKCNFVKFIVTIIFVTFLDVVPYNIGIMPDVIIPEMLLINLNYILEAFYYGHLLNLLNIRLTSIRKLLFFLFPTYNQVTSNLENESINYKDKNFIKLGITSSKIDIRKLMFLYLKIIKAFDFLNTAIKWQLLVILATSFVSCLVVVYYAALKIIGNEFDWQDMLFVLSMVLTRVAPLAVLCNFGERVHAEVLHLRRALYARTYNNVFDKTSRSIASSFLALTEIRSLSFSVFRMIELNISFPLKFFGLIASYVVILLQFQKVLKFEH